MTVEEFPIVIKNLGYDPDDLARHLEDIALKLSDERKEDLMIHPTWGEGVHTSRITELKSDWRDTFADIPRHTYWASSSPYLSAAWEAQKPKSTSDEDPGIEE